MQIFIIYFEYQKKFIKKGYLKKYPQSVNKLFFLQMYYSQKIWQTKCFTNKIHRQNLLLTSKVMHLE